MASATGIMPVALEYRAPTPMPSNTHFQIRPAISLTSATA
jgi:hypothetical protein